ncbi:unnamed protein product [Linum tenue]|uniref:Rab-GAP TBC domain-containing protein n=1 Tax=Linum tenue TaxID=586396 RepID=A0AAV0PNZ4_9ROSI|nr:unnamed protein product [Linum tenue]
MAENSFNFHHTLHHHGSRDSYGFVLRPQQLQRYGEYIHIYKEEEEERSQKWKIFLEQQENLDQPEEQAANQEVLQVETTTESREEAGSEGRRDNDDASYNEGPQEGQSTERPQEEVQCVEGPRKEILYVEDPEVKVQKTKEEPVKLPEEEVQPSEPSGSTIKTPEELHVSEEGEKKDLSKTSKAGKVPNWGQIRPSLKVIERLMSSRVHEQHHVKDKKSDRNGGDQLPVIEEDGSVEEEPDDGVEEESNVKDHVDDKVNEGRDERKVEDEPSLEPFLHWNQELEFLVHGGVPKDLRGEVWQAFVGAKARRIEKYYEDLLAEEANADESNDDNNTGVPQKWRKQIEKDIPRTFPGHPALDEHGRDSLRRILTAYARHNPSVGYCQAMNYFAGLLLLLMPEENAFWTFVGIIDDYFDGYYTEEMIESQLELSLHFIYAVAAVSHLEFMGVQVAWVSGPWFLSIFINMLPWESVLRIWDVLLFEGNRVMLFRTAFALMELYGPALLTTKDAGDAVTLLQSLAGSTFDSSQLVLTACVGFLAITEARLVELRDKHRVSVLEAMEERSRQGKVWKDSKSLATKLYSFKHDKGRDGRSSEGDNSLSGSASTFDDFLCGLSSDAELDCLPDLQDQVVWLKVELCRLLEEKRSAILRAEELETALMEMVKQDNRRELSAKIEKLEQEMYGLRRTLAEKKEQEAAMLEVLMRVEQEQKITEEARVIAEKEAAAQRREFDSLREKYDKAMGLIAQMEKRVVMAESMLEATAQYQSGQTKAQFVEPPGAVRNQSTTGENTGRGIGRLAFGLGWRDKGKGRPEAGDGNTGGAADT